MASRILLAVDGSPSAADAARLLATLPLQPGTEVSVLCVMDPFVEELLEHAQTEAMRQPRQVIAAAVDIVRRSEWKVREMLRAGDAAHQIVVAAEAVDADLVVVGSRGLSGWEGFLLGSVAHDVAKHAPCSVLIARPPRHGFREAVLCTDGSAHAECAAELARTLPLPPGIGILALHVLRPESPVLDTLTFGSDRLSHALEDARREEEARAARLLGTLVERLESTGLRAEARVAHGDPATEILAAAELRGADLVIAGTRGTSLIRGLVTGSVADRLLARCDCSLLLAR